MCLSAHYGIKYQIPSLRRQYGWKKEKPANFKCLRDSLNTFLPQNIRLSSKDIVKKIFLNFSEGQNSSVSPE